MLGESKSSLPRTSDNLRVSQEAEEGIPGKAAVIQKHASEPLFGCFYNFWDSWSLMFVQDNTGMS